ncbi:CRISPR-associated endonuclease Cas2, partial [Mycobacterium tuberculosis]|nr:CRISPR-associated endonuclease Cas2 [Mycobacterium tuberculosis]
EVDAAQWVALKARLMQIIDPAQDSLRVYYLGQHWRSKVEHIGAKPVLALDAPLVFCASARTPSDRRLPLRFAAAQAVVFN